MPLLTPDQLAQIRQIIQDASTALAVSTAGYKVTDEQIQGLVDDGFLQPGATADLVLTAFEHGALTSRLAEARNMSWADFQRHVKANPFDLSEREQAALEMAQQRAGTYCVGLGNTWNSAMDRVIVNADQDLADKMRETIRDTTASAVQRRRALGSLRSDFRQVTHDWGRDWDRIAHTEVHQAHQDAYMESTYERHGPEAMMAKVPDPDACDDCRRLYLDSDGRPRIMPASWWAEQGTNNVGRKKADWLPASGTAHPWCVLPGVPVITARGEVPIEEVQIGDMVWTARGRWRRVSQLHRHHHHGDTATVNGSCTVTGNHLFLVGDEWKRADSLYEGSKVCKVPFLDSENRPSEPGKVGLLARVLLLLSPRLVPVAAIDFDGYLAFPQAQVDKEASDHLVRLERQAEFLKGQKSALLQVGLELTCHLEQFASDLFLGPGGTPPCFVSPLGQCFALLGAKALHSDLVGFARRALAQPSLLDACDDGSTVHQELSGYRKYGEIFIEVKPDNFINGDISSSHGHGTDRITSVVVSSIKRAEYVGPVHNLSVEEDESYHAGGLAVHNCRCELQRVPDGMEFDEDGALVVKEDDEGKSLAPGDLAKGGPYIGPRGGKWADPKHTIPWTVEVNVHPRIFGREDQHTYHVTPAGGDRVQVSRYGRGKHGPVMHRDSLAHFKNDMEGKVDVPPHPSRPEITAVAQGKAEFLGKGDDGLAFKVGDKVVKVSTTVPYQPDNPGHRTPQEAVAMLRRQSEVGNKLADLGISGIQRSEFVEHGGRGFQIKPYVAIPKKFTRAQLDQIQDIVMDVHKHGYAINDAVQAGLDEHGNPVLFDVGKAAKQTAVTGIYSDVRKDLDAVASLYRDSGEPFVRHGQSEGEDALERVKAKWDKWLQGFPSKFMERHLNAAVGKLQEEAKATLDGEKLKRRLNEIEHDVSFMHMELEAKQEREAKGGAPIVKAHMVKGGGPYIGPRGGKWADPQHSIPWHEPKPGHVKQRKWGDLAISPTVDQINKQAGHAHGAMAEAVANWLHHPSHGKKLVFSAYAKLPDIEKAAMQFQIQDIVEHQTGGEYVTAWRYMTGDASDPKKVSGASLSLDPAWKSRDHVHEYKVHYSQIMLHYGQAHIPGNSHRRGELGLGFGHEREIILKPDAKVEHVGRVDKSLAKARKLQGELDFRGLSIAIENRRGSVRHWYDPHEDRHGKTKMIHPYGYIRGTDSIDGDHYDCFVGPDKDAPNVYVVHQRKPPDFTQYDEDKAMLGFRTRADAMAAYLAHYDSRKFIGEVTTLPFEEFKRKVLNTAKDPFKMVKARKPLPGQTGFDFARKPPEKPAGAPRLTVSHGGPYIGPRGGKWQDPRHTVPWKGNGGVPSAKIPEATISRLREDAHVQVRWQIEDAAKRAVAVGADPKALQYVGAGAEGIVLRDGGKAYKISRYGGGGKRKLEMEAAVMEAASGHPNAAKFYKYAPRHDVVVREHVEGSQGTWGHGEKLRDVHRDIGQRINAADLTTPEFKEDSYIINKDGVPKLVDAGFVHPTGARAARHLAERIDQAKPEDAGKNHGMDVFDMWFDVRGGFAHGDFDYETAQRMAEKLGDIFGRGADEYKQTIAALKFTHESRQKSSLFIRKAAQTTGPIQGAQWDGVSGDSAAGSGTWLVHDDEKDKLKNTGRRPLDHIQDAQGFMDWLEQQFADTYRKPPRLVLKVDTWDRAKQGDVSRPIPPFLGAWEALHGEEDYRGTEANRGRTEQKKQQQIQGQQVGREAMRFRPQDREDG